MWRCPPCDCISCGTCEKEKEKAELQLDLYYVEPEDDPMFSIPYFNPLRGDVQGAGRETD